MRILCLLLALVAGGCASTAPDHRGSARDRAAVLTLAQSFFDVLETKDADAARRLVLPAGQACSVRRAAGKRAVGTFAFEEWLAGLPSIADDMYEAWLEQPTVLIEGDVAVVWGSYEFDRNGERSHTGIDAFTIVRTDDGWRVASVLYSVVR